MARKKFPTEPPVPTKAPPGTGRRPSAKPPLNAHPLLIHGFLVRLPARPTNPARGVNRASIGVASVKARVQRPSDMKYEGPADDPTFH